MAQSLTGTTLAASYKSLLKAGTTSNGTVALSAGSTTERLVFGEDDGVDVRTAIYVSQDRVGIGVAAPDAILDIVGADNTLQILGSDSTSNSALKEFRMATRHYLTAEENFLMMYAAGGSSDNELFLGGGSTGFNAATDIHFYTAANYNTTVGTKRMTIDETGLVGIGTGTPDEELSIASATSAKPVVEILNTNDDTTAGKLLFKKNPASDGASADDDYIGTVQFNGGDSANVNTQYASIAVQSSDVTDGAESGFVKFSVTIDGDSDSILAYGGKDTANGTAPSIVFNEDAQDIDFRIEGVGAVNALVVQGSDGKVGIGLVAPQCDLHVDGADDAHTMAVTTPLALVGNWGGISFGNATTRKGGIFFKRSNTYTRGNLLFCNENTADDSECDDGDFKMMITAAGLVGIGGITPSVKLDVREATAADCIVRIVGGEAKDAEIELWADDGDDPTDGWNIKGTAAGLLQISSSYDAALAGSYLWSPKFYLDNNGNLGLTTTAFASGENCLAILNGAAPGSATTNTAGLYALGGDLYGFDDSGTALRLAPAASDERTKDNIVVIPNALSRLANVKGVTFNYTSFKDSSLPFKNKIQDSQEFAPYQNWGDDTRVGVIAQDVEKAYDGLDITNSVRDKMLTEEDAGENPEKYGEIKQVEIDSLIPLLIEAVKELSAKVEALENNNE
jgi:hypothetical protein